MIYRFGKQHIFSPFFRDRYTTGSKITLSADHRGYNCCKAHGFNLQPIPVGFAKPRGNVHIITGDTVINHHDKRGDNGIGGHVKCSVRVRKILIIGNIPFALICAEPFCINFVY